MAGNYDAYHVWLGIAPKHQPPHHYRLLGIELFESDEAVIEAAFERRMIYLQTVSQGERGQLAVALMDEVRAARHVLADPDERAAYDAALRQRLETEPKPPPSPPPSGHAEPREPPPIKPPVARAVASANPPATGLPSVPKVPAPLKPASPLPPPITASTAAVNVAQREPRGNAARLKRRRGTPYLLTAVSCVILLGLIAIAYVVTQGVGKELAANRPADQGPTMRSDQTTPDRPQESGPIDANRSGGPRPDLARTDSDPSRPAPLPDVDPSHRTFEALLEQAAPFAAPNSDHLAPTDSREGEFQTHAPLGESPSAGEPGGSPNPDDSVLVADAMLSLTTGQLEDALRYLNQIREIGSLPNREWAVGLLAEIELASSHERAMAALELVETEQLEIVASGDADRSLEEFFSYPAVYERARKNLQQCARELLERRRSGNRGAAATTDNPFGVELIEVEEAGGR